MQPQILRPSDPELFVRIGQIARAVGSDEFHVAVAGILGDMIRHDYKVIVRYSMSGLPDILFTHNFGQHLIDYYLQHTYERTDPFYGYWRATRRFGVIRLSDAIRYAQDREFYSSIYQPKLGIADEVAVMLPGMGDACLGIFLGRRRTRFANADIAHARLVFPCLEGLHRAHIGRLFARLSDRNGHRQSDPFSRPTLIVARSGEQIYSNRAWRRAVRTDATIATALLDLTTGRRREMRLPTGSVLHMESFDSDFALAPGGRMYVLDRSNGAHRMRGDARRPAADFTKLTPRERQVVGLIMAGARVGDMARRLGLSKGTIKNHRLRVYKKLGISSERALFLHFLPIAEQLQPDASARSHRQNPSARPLRARKQSTSDA